MSIGVEVECAVDRSDASSGVGWSFVSPSTSSCLCEENGKRMDTE